MPIEPDRYFDLSLDELREVSRFAVASAQEVLPLYEVAAPADQRPRLAIEAARDFVDGGPRTQQQRVVALDAHRSAKQAPTQAAAHAAFAAGDAAASAYLHPFAKADQVAHILRASAHAAHAQELEATDPAAAESSLARAVGRATPILIDVLDRYPPAPSGRSRVALLMKELDTVLRAA